MKILAFIPARGGSKGIPRKNIAPLLGKPLIAWTIEQALSVPEFICSAYVLIRFLLEFIHIEQELIGEMNMPEVVAEFAFVVAVMLLIPRISMLRPNTTQTTIPDGA